jgi:hypothetical protein
MVFFTIGSSITWSWYRRPSSSAKLNSHFHRTPRFSRQTKKKKTTSLLVHKRNILIERPQLVGELSVNFLVYKGVALLKQRIPTDVNLDFLDRNPYIFFIQVGSFHEELEHIFDKIHKCHIKILLGDFNVKVGREDIFKTTICNESLKN